MGAPATVDELLALVRKSGIIDEKRLAAYLEKDRTSLPSQPKELADRFVRDGLLTRFQAEQFLQGKWRRFTIGNYKVLERIGAGGMGTVFLCEHKFMRRPAALKVLPISQSKDPSALERFYREARAVAALDHPNIVRAYDIDQDENLHFLVMEYVDGASLQEIVQRSGPLNPIRCAHYISQAALGLQHAHEVAGLVHRDIKPGNIIVDRFGTVKLLDLGLARFFHDEDDLLTKKFDENVLGTADYLAPEQALDSHGVDIRADIYSLGGTFYFCLTGLAPFADGTIPQKLIWHQTRQPKLIRALRSDVPDEMIAIINKMMAKDPNQRYQSPLEVVHALAPWTQEYIPPPTETEMPRLSPAARGRSRAEMNSSLTTPAPSGPLSPRARKFWHVPDSSTPQPNIRSAPVPPAARPAAAMLGSAAAKLPEPRPFSRPAAGPLPTGAPKADPAATPIVPSELGLAESAEIEAPVQPASAPPIQEEDSLPVVGLASETEKLAKADTDPHTPRKTPVRRPRRAKPVAKHKEQRSMWWLAGIGGGALFVCLVGILVWRLSSAKSHKDAGELATRPPIFVSRSGQENALRTVSEAIRTAQDKDHIVVLDNIEEHLVLTNSKKELVIEAKPGIVWRFPPTEATGVVLNAVSNLRIRGFTFDGRNYVDQIMLLTGHCPGLTLEDVQLRGFRYYGIVAASCAGKKQEPVTFLRVQAPTTERKLAAIAFTVNPKFASAKINEHIVIQEGRFEGPYEAPVKVSDPNMIKDLVLTQNTPTDLMGAPK